MKEKPLCGYCYNECTDDCCDKRRIDVLERQLEEANQAFEHIRQITLNNHDHDTIRINKICNEQLKEQG